MLKYLFTLTTLFILLIVGIILGINNNQSVFFNYIIAQTHISLSTLIGIIFALGFISGWLILSLFYIKLKIQHMTLSHQIKKQSAIINKNPPLKAS